MICHLRVFDWASRCLLYLSSSTKNSSVPFDYIELVSYVEHLLFFKRSWYDSDICCKLVQMSVKARDESKTVVKLMARRRWKCFAATGSKLYRSLVGD